MARDRERHRVTRERAAANRSRSRCGWPHLSGVRATFPSSRASSSLNPLHVTRGRIEMGANISTVMVVVALAAGLWWGFARGRRQALLKLFSMAALALAVATLVAAGLWWAVVSWQGFRLGV